MVLILYDMSFKSTVDGDIGVAGRIVRLPAGNMVQYPETDNVTILNRCMVASPALGRRHRNPTAIIQIHVIEL